MAYNMVEKCFVDATFSSFELFSTLWSTRSHVQFHVNVSQFVCGCACDCLCLVDVATKSLAKAPNQCIYVHTGTYTQLTHTRDGINNGRVSCLWRNSICHVRILVQSNISWNFFGNCTSRKLKIYVNWLQNTWVLSNNYLVIYQQTAHRLNNLSSMIYNQHSCFCPLCLSASVFVMTVCLSFPFSADHFQLHMVREFKCSIYLCL